MKTVVLEEGIIKLVNQQDPVIKNLSDVKVKIAYSAICGYDMMMYHGITAPPVSGIGHEASGTVVETGPQAASLFQIGDRVAIDRRGGYCMECEDCRKGNYSFCSNVKYGTALMTEYVVYDSAQIYRLPDMLSLKEGCLIEPLTTGMHAVDKAAITYGKSAIILGGGTMGLIMLKLLLLHPVSKVVVVEPSPVKRKLAKEFGADFVIEPEEADSFLIEMDYTKGCGYDIVIEASGSKTSAKTAFNLLARGGALIYFGLYDVDWEFPFNLFNLYWKNASIHAVLYPGQYFTKAINLAPRLQLESLITGIFPFEKADVAFKEKSMGLHAKVVLDYTDNRNF